MKKMFLFIVCAVLARTIALVGMDGFDKTAIPSQALVTIPLLGDKKDIAQEIELRSNLNMILRDLNKLPDDTKLPKLASAYAVCEEIRQVSSDPSLVQRMNKKQTSLLQRAYYASKAIKPPKENRVDLSQIDAETKTRLLEIFAGLGNEKLNPQVAVASYAFYRQKHYGISTNETALTSLEKDLETKQKEKESLDNQIIDLKEQVKQLQSKVGEIHEDSLKIRSKSSYLQNANEILAKQRENSYFRLREQIESQTEESSELNEDIKKLGQSILDLKKEVNRHDEILQVQAEINTKQTRLKELDSLQLKTAGELKQMEVKRKAQILRQIELYKREATTLAEDVKKLQSIVDLKNQANRPDEVSKTQTEIETKLNRIKELDMLLGQQKKDMAEMVNAKSTAEIVASYLPSLPSMPSMPWTWFGHTEEANKTDAQQIEAKKTDNTKKEETK